MLMRALMILFFLVFQYGFVHAEEARHYLTGGHLPANLQERLDLNAELIRLGINTETLDTAGLAPVPFTEGVLRMAGAVREGRLPGAVIYLNTESGDAMPIGIGSRMIDPEAHETEWSTIYELGEVTGIVAVMPFVLKALEEDRLRPSDTMGTFFTQFQETDKEQITVEMLLRHSSGLAQPAGLEHSLDRNGVLQRIAESSLLFSPGTRCEKSGMNFVLLGLIMSRLSSDGILDHALREFLMPAGLVNTMADLPTDWRRRTAPGSYSEWHNRLTWGEPENPVADLLGNEAGNGGLYSTADDLGLYAKTMMAAFDGLVPDLATTPTLALSLMPASGIPGCEQIGLGWELGGLGDGSFGWDAPGGCSLWVNPKAKTFLVILSNADHPAPRGEGAHDPRDEVKALMLKAVRALGPDV